MPQTFYHFSHAVSAFFEMPTEAARALLPSHLQPLEVQHGSGVFALTDSVGESYTPRAST